MRAIRNKKAMVLTVIAALFAVVLLSTVAIRMEQTREHGESMVYRVRCDEMISFLDDMERDLDRAAVISGKRSAIHAVDLVVTEGNPFGNATERIEVMVRNGTLDGEAVYQLENQTLADWIPKINSLAEQRAFTSNMELSQFTIDVVPYTPWEFRVRIRVENFTLVDNYGYCTFNGSLPRADNWINGEVGITGTEDPLYTLETYGHVSRVISQGSHSPGELGNTDLMIDAIYNKTYYESIDGPCFFERLEGKLGDLDDATRHDYYVTMAHDMFVEEGLNIPKANVTIGLETFVSVSELQSRIPSGLQSTIIKENQSCVDHVYFGSPVGGRKVINVTAQYSWFRIDDQAGTNDHASYYNVDGALYD
ncbi:MAG: hypothetical protein ABIG20_03330 [archaeon]